MGQKPEIQTHDEKLSGGKIVTIMVVLCQFVPITIGASEGKRFSCAGTLLYASSSKPKVLLMSIKPSIKPGSKHGKKQR
jgi:hypothetical protein